MIVTEKKDVFSVNALMVTELWFSRRLFAGSLHNPDKFQILERSKKLGVGITDAWTAKRKMH